MSVLSIETFFREFYRPLGVEPHDWPEPWPSVLSVAFTPDETGHLPYSTVILSAPKKCLPAGECVWLQDGRYVPVESLVGREDVPLWSFDDIFGSNGLVPATGSVSGNGPDTIVELEMKSGFVLRRTPEHPVLTPDGWRPCVELRAGDKVGCPRKVPEPVRPEALDYECAYAGMVQAGRVPDGVFRASDESVRRFVEVWLRLPLTTTRTVWADRENVAREIAMLARRLGCHPGWNCLDRGGGGGPPTDAERLRYPAALEVPAGSRFAGVEVLRWEAIHAVRRPVEPEPTYAVTVPGYENFLAYEVSHNSGKTLVAAGIALWFACCMSEKYGEIVIAANKRDQAKDRAYEIMRRAIVNHPILRKGIDVQERRILVRQTRSKIVTVTNEAGTEAGANPELVVHDEAWNLRASDRTWWAELTPVPTRRNSLRLVASYAGHPGMSEILYDLYEKSREWVPHPALTNLVGLDGEPVVRHDPATRSLCFWDTALRMPWQTDERARQYYREQRATLSQGQYLRLHHNAWGSGGEGLDMDAWDSCTSPEHRPEAIGDTVWLAAGVDASVRRDYSAVVSVYRDGDRFAVGPYRIWNPKRQVGAKMDLESTIEAYLLRLKGRARLKTVWYDSFQMVRSAATLKRQGVRMEEYTQTPRNLAHMATVLTELLRDGRLILPADPALKRQAANVKLKPHQESGVILARSARGRPNDAIVALAMAVAAAQHLPDPGRSPAAGLLLLNPRPSGIALPR